MKRTILSGIVAAAMLSSAANAAVVIGEVTGGTAKTRDGGVFQKVVPTAAAPISVGQDNQQSPNLFAMDEKQNVTLLADIASLRAGTVVNSHYVWFDPARNSRITGSVTFANKILAVLTTRNELSSTDIFGNTNATYRNPGARGLEGNDTFDVVGNTLSVNFSASSPGDTVRVFTAVPEPSTWLMLILGFGLIGAALRVERTRQRTRVAISYS